MSDDALKKLTEAVERIGKVIGALYASQISDLEQGIKAERLSRCGFSNTEIADLLGTSSNTINVALHKARRQRNRKKRPRAKK